MFKITANPKVTARVPLAINGEDHSFTATFNILPASRMRPENLDSEEKQRQLLVDAIADVDDIVGANGEKLPWSEVRDVVLDRVDAVTALIAAYMKAVRETAEGNLPGRLANGSQAA